MYSSTPVVCAAGEDARWERTLAGVLVHPEVVRELVDDVIGHRRGIRANVEAVDFERSDRLVDAGSVRVPRREGDLPRVGCALTPEEQDRDPMIFVVRRRRRLGEEVRRVGLLAGDECDEVVGDLWIDLTRPTPVPHSGEVVRCGCARLQRPDGRGVMSTHRLGANRPDVAHQLLRRCSGDHRAVGWGGMQPCRQCFGNRDRARMSGRTAVAGEAATGSDAGLSGVRPDVVERRDHDRRDDEHPLEHDDGRGDQDRDRRRSHAPWSGRGRPGSTGAVRCHVCPSAASSRRYETGRSGT